MKEFSDKCTDDCRASVMVVDDDPMNCLALEGLVKIIGLTPKTFCDGMEALQGFQAKYRATCCSNRYDVILTDLQMPKMDGFKFASCVRATEAHHGPQIAKASEVGKVKTSIRAYIMAITASYCVDENVKAQSGVDRLIYKPASLPQIMSAIKEYLVTNFKEEPNEEPKVVVEVEDMDGLENDEEEERKSVSSGDSEASEK